MAINPTIEVIDKKDKYVIKAELPGMEEADIDVSITGNLLTVKGEKCTETKTDEDRYYYQECSYGSFSRTIPLPSEVNEDKAEAEYDNGVLEISLPKLIEIQTKKVSVAKKKAKVEAKAETKDTEKVKAEKKQKSKVKGEKKEKKAKK
jgi:HSP20 family protein